SARSLDSHHSGRPAVAVGVLRTRRKRHGAGGGDPHSHPPTGHLRSNGIHHARAIDPRDERQNGLARGFPARAQAHIKNPIDRRGVHPDADFPLARPRIGHLFVTKHIRRAVVVYDDGFHLRSYACGCSPDEIRGGWLPHFLRATYATWTSATNMPA